jgi:hypothetical protein
MKKNVKAIIAALSASIMCAVPVAASFASTAATTSITAEAASDLIKDASLISTNGGTIVITNGAITYRITGSNTAELYGRYNQVSQVEMADKIRYNNRLYKVTKVRPYAFKNAHRTATGSGVTYFRCGKYVEEIGDQAFYNSSVGEVDLHGARSLKTIGNGAFAYSSVGPLLYIPGTVSTIRANAFRNCRWLEDITIDGGISLTPGVPNLNDNPISIGSGAFAELPELRYMTVYRRYPKANGTLTPDYTVFSGRNPDFDPDYDISGNVYGVPEFIRLFFHS